jgi:hypothetical protein
MDMTLQEAKEWCEQRGVTLTDYQKRDGTHYILLSKDDKKVEFLYTPNEDGSREAVLRRVVDAMKLWLDAGIVPLNGLWVSNS